MTPPVVVPLDGSAHALAALPVARVLGELYGAPIRVVHVREEGLPPRELAACDAVLSVTGGHGFRMIEDTVLFEIKQGPYGGMAEKERFTTAADGEPL